MRGNNKIIFAIGIILLSGAIVFFGGTRPVRLARAGAVDFFRPLMVAVGDAGRWLGRKSVGSDEVRRLREENERLTAENFDREKLARDIGTLESAFAFRKSAGIALTGGRVLSYTRELGREILVLDQGTNAGVKDGDAVIDGYGALVGDVDDAGDNSSRVVVASNAGVTFPAFFMRGEGTVLARGLGARAFSVELIPRSVPISQGDFLARRVSGRGGREHMILVASMVGGGPDGAGWLTRGTQPDGVGGFISARAVLVARPETLEYVFIIQSHDENPS